MISLVLSSSKRLHQGGQCRGRTWDTSASRLEETLSGRLAEGVKTLQPACLLQIAQHPPPLPPRSTAPESHCGLFAPGAITLHAGTFCRVAGTRGKRSGRRGEGGKRHDSLVARSRSSDDARRDQGGRGEGRRQHLGRRQLSPLPRRHLSGARIALVHGVQRVSANGWKRRGATHA